MHQHLLTTFITPCTSLSYSPCSRSQKKSVIAKGYKTRAGANRAVFEGRKMKTVSSYVGVGSSSVVMRYFNSWNIKTTSLNLKHLKLTTRLYSS